MISGQGLVEDFQNYTKVQKDKGWTLILSYLVHVQKNLKQICAAVWEKKVHDNDGSYRVLFVCVLSPFNSEVI